jgi:uncharacterized membrane protein YhaH (DUF805 family)
LNRACRKIWVRAGLLHPAVFVAPWVALCLLLADLPGSDIGDVDWGFLAIPIGALASFVTTAVMAVRRPLPLARRGLLVLLGLLASGVALVAGLYGWIVAADTACHGRYECPL